MRIIEKKLSSVEYAQVERILEKIAAENGIQNVESINVEITDKTATIKYAADGFGDMVSGYANQALNAAQPYVNQAKDFVSNQFGPANQPPNPYGANAPGQNPYGEFAPKQPTQSTTPGITAPETYGNDASNPATPWGNSISEFLDAQGLPSDFNSRRQMAVQYGVVTDPNQYTGTAQQNTQLLGLLSSGQGQQPAPVTPPVTPSVTPTVNPGVTPTGETPTPTPVGPNNAKYGPGALSPQTGKPIEPDGKVTLMDGSRHTIDPTTGDLLD